MKFWKDMEKENGIWVDRGIDGRLDNFPICGPCSADLQANDPQGQSWHDGQELCPSCRADFQAHALAVDLLGLPRPFNGMLEDRVLTNDEVGADPAPPVPGAIEYFVPGVGDPGGPSSGDPYLPGKGDPFVPGAGDPFQPGAGDPLLPRPYDGFLPGLADPFLPNPNNYLWPGMEDYLLPE